jgi:hypothetical protein
VRLRTAASEGVFGIFRAWYFLPAGAEEGGEVIAARPSQAAGWVLRNSCVSGSSVWLTAGPMRDEIERHRVVYLIMFFYSHTTAIILQFLDY